MRMAITGASRGLGAELAREFAAPGVWLGLVARDLAALEAVAADYRARGAIVEVAACDVQDAARLAAALLAWDDAAPITHLVANAGITGGTPPGGGLEGWEGAARVLGVNLLGAVNAVEPLLPRMLARRSGRVVLIASVAAFRALPDAPAYSASKAGLWSYGEALRARLGPARVGVTVVAPGFFASALSARFQGPKPGQVSAGRMAATVARGIRRGRGRIVSPWALGALLRMLELLPAPLADRAARVLRFTIRGG